MEQFTDNGTERRFDSPDYSTWWTKLSLAQKFSVSSLAKFGYELLFIRYDENNNFAVLVSDSGLAVVSNDGEIDTAPNLKVR